MSWKKFHIRRRGSKINAPRRLDASGDFITVSDAADWTFGSGGFTIDKFRSRYENRARKPTASAVG